MSNRTSLTLTDERRRLEDRLREELDDELPDTQFRTQLIDMAYKHLLDSLRNAEEAGTDVCHDCKIHFNTRVIKHRTETRVETKRP